MRVCLRYVHTGVCVWRVVVTGNVSALWSVCMKSGGCLCEVYALCSIHVTSGVCLCVMYALPSVSVQCVW